MQAVQHYARLKVAKLKHSIGNEQGSGVEHVASWKELNGVGNSSMSESKSIEQEPRVRA